MHKQRASALLSALFVMTLVAIAATAMSTRLQLDIYRTRLIIENDKLLLASQLVALWAMDTLMEPEQNFVALDDFGRVSDMPTKIARLYPEVSVQGSLYDLQARFNINNLKNDQFQLMFLNLLKQKVPEVDSKAQKNIMLATTAWINDRNLAKGQDIWETYYSEQKPPYLPGYQPMKSLSEFRLVAEVTPSIYQKLAPWLTALPNVTPINLNTASKTVLMTLGVGLTEGQVSEFIALRKANLGLTENELGPFVTKYNISRTQVGLVSQYYLSVAIVKGANLYRKHYTIIERRVEKNKTVRVKILSETMNAD